MVDNPHAAKGRRKRDESLQLLDAMEGDLAAHFTALAAFAEAQNSANDALATTIANVYEAKTKGEDHEPGRTPTASNDTEKNT